MKHGFIKLGAATPDLFVAAPTENIQPICDRIDEAYAAGVHVLAFPELSLTGATCGDLFFTDALLDNTLRALDAIVHHTAGKQMLTLVGAPLRFGSKLYDCAVAIADGEILGVVPKTHVPGDASAASLRYFTPATPGMAYPLELCGTTALFSPDCVFHCAEAPALRVGCQLGEDFYALSSPAEHLAALGATVIVTLAATPETIGRADYRRTFIKAASGKQIAAHLYADAGMGESTTDTVYAGHAIIAENGQICAENAPFDTATLTTAVVDCAHLIHDRMRTNAHTTESDLGTQCFFSLNDSETDLTGVLEPSPFLPVDPSARRDRCRDILAIQAHGLAKRIRAAYAKGCVVALSGGLDSTLALIVTAQAMDILGRPHSDITTVTMPCFGTTSRTRSNAERMAVALDTAFRCIDIKEAVDLHFRDIGHDPENLSVVYENAQARERTQIIMDIANADGSLVIGTGDLSELALGWATYNGDHMSNYGVNGGIPKTLVRHVVAYYADRCDEAGQTELAAVLRDVLATPVSPELLPAKDGEIAQKTEDIVGPYDLHDFFLYRFVRYGETPEKIFRCAKAALGDRFDDDTIKHWLNTFLRRFYQQQFKRSALPDGPMVGSVVLSPRGAWMMPSDACGREMHID